MKAAANHQLVVVGRIGAPYGVRGWVRITSYTDPPANLGDYQPWLLADRSVVPVRFKAHQKGFVAQLSGVSDREAAATLAGQEIRIHETVLPAAEEDEYYWRDLIGLEVQDPVGQVQGKVVQLLETGAHDVLVVAASDGREILVPFERSFVQRIDIDTNSIVIEWPEFDPDGA